MTRYYMDLIGWQKAMDLVTEIYRLTKQLPKEEVFWSHQPTSQGRGFYSQ
jgi:hypothetical protein